MKYFADDDKFDIFKVMRMILAVLMMLAFATSLLAQGQFVESSEVLTAGSQKNIDDISALELPTPSGSTPSEWLPCSQRPSFPSSDLSFVEASCETSLIDTPVMLLFSPTPLTDKSSFTIQAVPEPSFLALLAVGLLMCAAVFHHSRESSSFGH